MGVSSVLCKIWLEYRLGWRGLNAHSGRIVHHPHREVHRTLPDGTVLDVDGSAGLRRNGFDFHGKRAEGARCRSEERTDSILTKELPIGCQSDKLTQVLYLVQKLVGQEQIDDWSVAGPLKQASRVIPYPRDVYKLRLLPEPCDA